MTLNNSDANIIILTPYEEFIAWLDPEKVSITETNKTSTQRTISLSYPVEQNLDGTTSQWFEQGNKIYIPGVLGIDSCLYVINTSYTIDYWENNNVTLTAEEVLTEFNYQMFEYTDDASLKISKDNLEKWFGEFYTIGTIDKLTENKDSINPAGTLTKMSLLRLIEESTDRVFYTEYELKDNNIIRTLNLKKEDNIGKVQTEYLDLNRNVESMELEVDESSTYNAMAPVISLDNSMSTTTSTVTSTATSTITDTQSSTSSTEDNRTKMKKVISTWKAKEISYRESIPMIIEKESDGSVKYLKYWYAPFSKDADSLYIYDNSWSNMTYNSIIPQKSNNDAGKINPKYKIGTVTTSETDVYAIYNVLANSLLEKRTPKFTLKISVKDIQVILGENNLGYSLYDKLYVRIPGFDYYVKCLVTETKKNLHLPGENTITLSSTINGTHIQDPSIIISNDIIVSQKYKNFNLGGVLETLDDKPLPGELVSLNVQLVEAATSSASDSGSSATDLQEVLDWNPTVDYYVFSDSEIQNMAAVIKDSYIDNKVIRSVNMRTVSGSIYRVPLDWCRAIWFARNQWFEVEDLDNGLGNGTYSATLKVHQYASTLADYKKIMNETIYDESTDKTWYKYQYLSYWSCWFYLLLQETREYIKNTYNLKTFDGIMDVVSSWDLQQLGDCGAGALSSISEYLYNYVSENMFLLQICDKGGNLNPANLSKVKNLFGFDVQWVEATWENVKKYTNNNQRILVFVQSKKLGYAYKDVDNMSGHVICIASCWTGTDKDGNTQQMVYVNDTNMYDFIPNRYFIKDSSFDSAESYKDRIIPWSQLLNAIDSVKLKNDSTMYSSARTHSSYDYKTFCVISLNSSQRTPTLIREAVTDTTFNPKGMKYEFSAEEIKKTYLERAKWMWTNLDKDVNTANFIMKDRYGNQWNMNGSWVSAIHFAYTYTYITNPYVNQTNKIITVDKNSTSQWYYNTRGTDYYWWGDYRLTKDVVKQLTNPLFSIISCEICWDMGVFYTLKEMNDIIKEYDTKVGDITNSTPSTLAIMKLVTYALNKKSLTVYTKQVTEPNKETLNKYKNYYGVAAMNINEENNYDKLEQADYIHDLFNNNDAGYLVILNKSWASDDNHYSYNFPYLKGNGPNYYQNTRWQDVTDTQTAKLGLYQDFNLPIDQFLQRINHKYDNDGVNPVVFFSRTPFTE